MSLSDRLWIAFSAAPGISINHGFWYLLLAGLAWFLLHWLLARRLTRRRIHPEIPTRRQLGREFLCSLRSVAIFGAVGGIVAFAVVSGWTRMYFRIDRHGWGYFVFSFFATVLIHDAYFYWTHRLMHHRWLYRRFHHTHHLSISPSPWAAYAFSPWEAVVQAGIAPLVIFTLPVHPLCFSLFMTWQIAFNVLGHCGYELFPRWFVRSPAGCLLNTSTHHAMHHESFRANFSLYFNIWDRLLGTNHPQYAEQFQSGVGQAAAEALAIRHAEHPPMRAVPASGER